MIRQFPWIVLADVLPFQTTWVIYAVYIIVLYLWVAVVWLVVTIDTWKAPYR